jgi:outer membrane protein TolC
VTRQKRIVLSACSAALIGWCSVQAQPTNSGPYSIDLPTALRLVGAQNLDVQIARARLVEARANRQSAVEQFFPWLAPGIGFHRRDGVAQAVPSGVISDAHYDSYYPGVTLGAQLSVGEALYNNLAAKQLVKASDLALETQRQDATLSAAQSYFELAKAKALVAVARQAMQTSQEYQQQLHTAVAAGIAFKGDELRVQTQTERYQIALRQAFERQRVAGADLAQVLHLDPSVELIPLDTGEAPIRIFETNAPLALLVGQALQSRPELLQNNAILSASRATKDAAVYGPLVPALTAQVFGGGLGGGPDGGPSNFGAEGDYTLGLTWRIGPGGLFDVGRIGASKAKVAVAELNGAKLKDAVIAQVVSALARMQSLGDQIPLVQQNLATAAETLRLTRERKQFGVGVVLEDILAEQALTQARADFFSAVAEFNKSQYALSRAVGGPQLVP